MKILFIYSVQKSIIPEKPLLGQEGIYHGISYISGFLKSHGYPCELMVLDRVNKKKNPSLIHHKIEAFKPDIVAFTAVFSEFEFITNIAKQIRTSFPGLFLIAGGVHITLNPKEEYLDLFDAICVGEGEYPFLELVEKLETGDSIQDIQNIWLKTENGIIKNPTRPFIQNLDTLPFPDREMWQEWILEPNTKPTVLLGRGCPFGCTYCSNHKLRKVSSGKYVRMRSPESILAEIHELHRQLPEVNEIYLEVETIALDLDWLTALCNQLYTFGKETNFQVKFATNLRIYPKLDIEYTFKQFKKANITSVTIGLESGSYRIRKEILNRDYSNELIMKAATLAENMNIDIALFNMIGLPTETPENFSETLEMNQKIQPTFHATSIFFPYPGTELAKMCEDMKLLPQNINTDDERQIAVLDLPGFSKKEIQQSFDSFHYNVYKIKKNKSFLKQAIYYSMRFVGHNFYANLKISFIRFTYKTNSLKFLNKAWFSIFQKSK